MGDGLWRAPRGEYGWPLSSLLGSLADKPRARLLQLGARAQYPDAGRVLMREDDATGFVLVLLDGVVKVTARMPDGREALLGVNVGGDIVGEFAVLDGKPRSATVTACGAVVAQVVGRTEFLAFLDRDAQVARAVSQVVVNRARAANSKLIDFAGTDVATRLARVLHELAARYGERRGTEVVIKLPLTQPELATLAGASEHTVHRILRELRDTGVVDTGYRTIRILSLAALHRLAYPEPD
jgi:CRP/FNR family transcriptional regulator, cyclic AMP receptor protein